MLKDLIYTFAGYNGYTVGHPHCDKINDDQVKPNGFLNSIEFLDARSVVSNRSGSKKNNKWTIAPSFINTREPRINVMVAYHGTRKSGSRSLVFFGGTDSAGEFTTDGFIFLPIYGGGKNGKPAIIRCMTITYKYGGSDNNQCV